MNTAPCPACQRLHHFDGDLEALDPAAATGWVALHRVRAPGNLGTVIRTADAAGCGAVILVGECCDP